MAYGDEFLTNRFTVAGPSFTGGHPLQVPETFVPPGSADFYRGYFGMTSITGFQKGSLNVGVNLDSPLGIYGAPGSPHFFDVGTILTLIGDHRVVGRSSVTGTEFRTNVANAHILGSTAQLVGKTVNVTGSKSVGVQGVDVRIDSALTLILNGRNWDIASAFWDSKKPFDILHPTKEGHRLRYVCLEGPSAEVYFRGKLKDDNVIKIPDYWMGLVDEETIGVNLTPIGVYQELFVEKIDITSGIKIKNNSGNPIHCHYVVYGERKDTSKNIPEYPGLTPNDYPGDNREYRLNF